MKKLRHIWKNFLASFTLCITIITLTLMVVVPAHAAPDKPCDPNPSSAAEANRCVGNTAKLNSYENSGHANASVQDGANTITSAIFYVIDFVKYVIGTLTVVMIIISGVRLVYAGKAAEEESKKQKEHLKFAIIGLMVIIIADQMVKTVFFGQQGEIFSSKSTLQEAAKAGSAQIRGIYEMIAFFSGALAILMIVVAGFRYVSSGGNEETMKKAKTQIVYAVIGLVLIGVAEFAIKDIIFPQEGSKLTDVGKAKQLIVSITNFVAGFISTIAAVMYMYGGYIYVTAFGNEEAAGKAKKVFIGATVGLLLASAAFAIVNTTVRLENQLGPSTGAPNAAATAGSSAPSSLPTNGSI